jgi:phosphate/sulfate permease
MSQEAAVDLGRPATLTEGERAERRGGLNRDTVVKLLIAWTVTPIFSGVVAALAYFIISRF